MRSEPIHTLTHLGREIHIYPDNNSESPDSWGNEDIFLITTLNRYFSVQRKDFTLHEATSGAYKEDYHVLPLYAYIHSGVALSLGRDSYPFTCPWDSGQIGVVLVKKRAGFRNIRKAALSLIEEWNQYLSGDVYSYEILSEGELKDSCWGFYGLDYCIKEAKQAAAHAAKEGLSS